MKRILDIFCGCGGMSLGFQNAGFKIVGAFDNWKSAVDVYNKNFTCKACLADVYDLAPEYLDAFSPDVIIGGPPCQDYSSAGKLNESGGRAELTLKFSDLICKIMPVWFVMENVDRISQSHTLKETLLLFKDAGYGLTQIILDASLCGVPQKRKRFFLIGHINDSDDFLYGNLVRGLSSKSMTVRDYFGSELNTEYFYRHPRSYTRRGVFSIDEPSPVIRGVNRPIPPGYRFHPGDAVKDMEQIRPLTAFERARIQTFPQNFIFEGSKTEMEQMIGNAVPVKLAEYVAVHLLRYMETCN